MSVAESDTLSFHESMWGICCAPAGGPGVHTPPPACMPGVRVENASAGRLGVDIGVHQETGVLAANGGGSVGSGGDRPGLQREELPAACACCVVCVSVKKPWCILCGFLAGVSHMHARKARVQTVSPFPSLTASVAGASPGLSGHRRHWCFLATSSVVLFGEHKVLRSLVLRAVDLSLLSLALLTRG